MIMLVALAFMDILDFRKYGVHVYSFVQLELFRSLHQSLDLACPCLELL